MSKYKQHKGFSLVELMVALTLGIFLIGGVILMYLSGKSTSTDSEALSRIQENVRFATDYLVRDLRNAGFDDVAGLTIADVGILNSPFLAIDNTGNQISIRYAGRGHCGERFDQFMLVQNTYFVSTDGELTCTGWTWNGTDFVAHPEDVTLVSGVRNVSFQAICEMDELNNYVTLCGATECSTDLENRCVGVRIQMDFEGLRAIHADDEGIRSVELTAGLRNSVMKILYEHAINAD